MNKPLMNSLIALGIVNIHPIDQGKLELFKYLFLEDKTNFLCCILAILHSNVIKRKRYPIYFWKHDQQHYTASLYNAKDAQYYIIQLRCII